MEKDLLFKYRKITENVLKYAQWQYDTICEEIKDYIDDDKIGNAGIISELKEERERWHDILRIINNDYDLYNSFILEE